VWTQHKQQQNEKNKEYTKKEIKKIERGCSFWAQTPELGTFIFCHL
jgi:hypothetical protein